MSNMLQEIHSAVQFKNSYECKSPGRKTNRRVEQEVQECFGKYWWVEISEILRFSQREERML